MKRKSRSRLLALLLCLVLFLSTGCLGRRSSPQSSRPDQYNDDGTVVEEEEIPPGELIHYDYFDEPQEALHTALAKQADAEFVVGEISTVQQEYATYQEIPVYWRGETAPSCLIYMQSYVSNYNGAYNDASFRVLFKDPEALDDAVAIATPILQHIDPSLTSEAALRRAQILCDTWSVDGYGDALDIGGYQVQYHNTYPLEYYSIGDFNCNMGIYFRALGTILGDFNTSGKPVMTFEIWSNKGKDGFPETAQITGTVTEYYQRLDYYGTPESFIEVSGENGVGCFLRITHSSMPYIFNPGGRYTIYITLTPARGPTVMYAIQHYDFD